MAAAGEDRQKERSKLVILYVACENRAQKLAALLRLID
jgi:hypothetical protein